MGPDSRFVGSPVFVFMDDATQMLVDGIEVIEDSVGATINWNGGPYPCAGGAELGGKMLGYGGYRTTAQVTIVARAAVFPAKRPREKDKLIYTSAPDADPRALRIDNLTVFRNAVLVMECTDPNQGA